MTKNESPSAQGGVVREPVYWDRAWALIAATNGAKSSAPVSVIVPGLVMLAMLAVACVRRDVVSPASESWKCVAITAIDPSVST